MNRVADRAGGTYERAMRVAVLLFFTASITACAGTGGAWPSLAPRPIEKAVSGGAISPTTIALATPAPLQLPSRPSLPLSQPLPSLLTQTVPQQPFVSPLSSPDIADVAARLSTIERDRIDLAARVAAQLAETRSAVAARGTKIEGDAWSKAQLEVTRLERLGSQATDLHDRLDMIAGTLAEVAASGVEVTGLLKATGQAIGRVRALDAEVSVVLARASSATP